MEQYLDQLTYEELDAFYFAVMNANPASDFLNVISAAINRKHFPLEVVYAEVIEEPIALELVAGLV